MDVTKTFSAIHLEPGSVVADRYEVLEQVGKGGMGIVFRVLDRELEDDQVALKVLHPHLNQNENVFRRFRNEVLIARSLTHPNIVRLHDIGNANEGFSYISMEFVRGYSLKDRLTPVAERTDVNDSNVAVPQLPLSFEEILQIYFRILAGVAYAHEKRVVHRDLKPANVMIGVDGEVKLADFGTARFAEVDTALTQAGQILGTPDYMSPEQIRGESPDLQCDIYSLGIIGFEMVTSRRPFTAESPVALAYKHLNEELPDATEINPDVPDWFQQLIAKASAKKKEDRFASVMDMAGVIAEAAPDITSQAGYFSVDSSHARMRVLGAQPSDGETVAEGSAQFSTDEFQLGDAEAESDAEWSLGYGEAKERTTLESAKEFIGRENKSPAAVVVRFVLALCAFLLLGIGVVRIDRGANQWASAQVRALERSVAFDIQFLYPLLALDSEVDGVVLSTHLGAEESVDLPTGRDELLEELLGKDAMGGQGGDRQGEVAQGERRDPVVLEGVKKVEPEVPQNPKAEQRPVEEAPKMASKLVVGESSQDPVATKSPSEPMPGAASASKPVKSTPVVPEKKPLPLQAEILVRVGRNGPAETSFNLSRLADVQWSATIEGAPNPASRQKRSQFVKKLSVNIFSYETSRVLVKLYPDDIRPDSSKRSAARVTGYLRKLREKKADPGNYRIDLIHSGEVLASREISFYQASVSMGAVPSTGAQPVSIVRGPTYMEGGRDEARPGTSENTEPVEIVSDKPLPVAPQPQLGVGFGSGATAGAIPYREKNLNEDRGGLPPARTKPVATSAATESGRNYAGANEGSQFNRSSIELARDNFVAKPVVHERELERPIPVAPGIEYGLGERESYSGDFVIGGAGGERRAMILNLKVRNKVISGTARIDGYGSFQASGQYLPRGLEISLRNQEYSIRLTGAKRDMILRGRFFIPSEQQQGRWQVKLFQ